MKKLERSDLILDRDGKELPQATLEETLKLLGREVPKKTELAAEEFVNHNHTRGKGHPNAGGPIANLPEMPAGIGVKNQQGQGTPEDFKFAMKVYNVKTTGGVRAEVDDVSWWGKEMSVAGSFYVGEKAPGGKVVGTFHRTFSDKGTVVHQTLNVVKDMQSQGIASEFNRHAEDMYRAYGVRQIKLQTTLIGGYAWAAAGYEFDGPIRQAGGAIVQGLRGMAEGHDARRQPYSPAVVSEVQHLLSRIDHGEKVAPYEIAQIGRSEASNNMWPGKSLMIGMEWYGVKHLDAIPRVSVNTEEARASDRARLTNIMKTTGGQ